MKAIVEEGYTGRVAIYTVNSYGTVTGRVTKESYILVGVGQETSCES